MELWILDNLRHQRSVNMYNPKICEQKQEPEKVLKLNKQIKNQFVKLNLNK